MPAPADRPDPGPEAPTTGATDATAAELCAWFAASWRGAELAALPALAPRLAELCAAARAAHPALEEAPLLAAIAARAPMSADELPAYLARCRAGELALALAAAAGRVDAIAELERRYGATMEAVCRRFAGRGQGADDLRQVLRARLLVAEGDAPPKLAEYAGQGFLENWLRVTAVRLFLDQGKRKDRAREEPAAEAAVLALPDVQDLGLELVKAEHREAVAAALQLAAQQLAPGDRHLLRQHLVAGLSIDQLGAALGVHRATAARRLASAREQLAAATRRELARRLGLPMAELDEVLAQAMSRLDVSLSRLLATAP